MAVAEEAGLFEFPWSDKLDTILIRLVDAQPLAPDKLPYTAEFDHDVHLPFMNESKRGILKAELFERVLAIRKRMEDKWPPHLRFKPKGRARVKPRFCY